MIAIAVVASLVVYAWVSGYIGFQTNKAGESISLPSLAGVVHTGTNIGDLVVYVQNVGQGTVEVSAVYVDDTLIDETDLSYIPDPPGNVISEGSTVEITIDGNFNLDERHDIKVTTTSGTSMTYTGKPGTGGSVTPDALTASITPADSLTMTAGETQTFTASSSGGTGSKSYQWYLDNSVVSGETSLTYTYTAATGSHDVYVKVTDSASTPVQRDSNTVTITVNSALVAPTISTDDILLTSGQIATLTSTTVNTGTSPYTYQWLRIAPGETSYSEISGATSTSYSFEHRNSAPFTAHGSWYFMLKVTDSKGAVVTSNTVAIGVG